MEKSFVKLTIDITDEEAVKTFKKLWLNSFYGKNAQSVVAVDDKSEWVTLHLNAKWDEGSPIVVIRKSSIMAIKQYGNNRAILITNHNAYFCEESYSDMVKLITN